MSDSKQIKVGALLSYLSISINILAGLLYTPWMINQIGKNQYGLYTLANSLITLFLIDFGLSSATARYISKYKAEKNQEKINNFLGAIYKLYLLVDIVICLSLIVVFFFLDKIYVNLTNTELEIFKIVYIISAIYSILNFPFVTLNGILTAYEKFIQLKLADVLYRSLIVSLTIVALLLGKGIYALVTVNAIAGFIITGYKLYIIHKKTDIKINFYYYDKLLYKNIFGFSIWITVSILAQRLIFSITPSILGVMSNTASIAIFGIVTTIEGYTYIITNAINGMFMPKISKIYNEKNSKTNLEILMLKVGRFQFILNGLIIVGFLILGKTFIELWVGKEYLDAYMGILLVIIPGLFFNSLQIANTAMIVQNKVKIQAYITLVTGIINICLSPIFINYFGVKGACFSIFMAYMVRAILCNIIYYKVLKIDIIAFIKKCYIGMSPIIIITVIVGRFIDKFFYNDSWIYLIVEGLIIVIIYLILVFCISLSKEEKEEILNILKIK